MKISKLIILLLLLCLGANLSAQQDTLYFDIDFKKTTKVNATFLRPRPLEKVGKLFHIKDYYSNGNPYKDFYLSIVNKKPLLQGKSMRYSKNGIRNKEVNYKDDKAQDVKIYSEDGLLKATGIFKDEEQWEGDFPAYGNSNKSATVFKEGKLIGFKYYYKGTNKTAVFKKIGDNEEETIQYFDRKGNAIGAIKKEGYYNKNGVVIEFEKNSNDEILIKESLTTYKNTKKNGVQIFYDKEEKELSKGVNKDDFHWAGTFHNKYFNVTSSFKKGVLHGEQKRYNEDGTLVFTEKYKKGKILNKQYHAKSFGDGYWKCIYQNEEPFIGETTEANKVIFYANGQIIKVATFTDERLATITHIQYYKNNSLYKQVAISNDKSKE